MYRAVLVTILLVGNASGQSVDIDSLILEVRLDSLESYVEYLSGMKAIAVTDTIDLFMEEPDTSTIQIADTLITLSDRWHVTNDVATEYLRRTLTSFGLDTVVVDQDTTRPWLKNVLGIKVGSVHPDKWYIVCAHYDGVRNAPAADDNGSGTAAVLEAARLLANAEPNSSILFALWDSEEVGLHGSVFYAKAAVDSALDIVAVINADMIGWDGDDDHVAEIHTDFQSSFVANEIARNARDFAVDLTPVFEYPGARGSDHSPFWDRGYPGVLLIEEFRGGDFNPHYHQPSDSLVYFNLDYFHEMAKLVVASIAHYATDSGFEPIVHVEARVMLEGAYEGGAGMAVSDSFKTSIPLSQPYADTLFDATPLEHDSSTSVTTFPDSTIDWVLASLRSDVGPETEIEGSRRAALLMQEGTVVDTNGLMMAFPGVLPGGYRLVIRHRNHAAVMSSDTLDTSDGVGSWNFTPALSQAYSVGPAAMKDLGGGRYGMFAGEGSLDGLITVNDFGKWLPDTKAGATGYRQTDFDLDAQVTITDFALWLVNSKAAAASQVPE